MKKKAQKIIDRMLKILSITTLAALARWLDVDPSLINRAIRENKVPDKWILLVAQKKQLRVEWLEDGEGPQTLDEQVAETRARYGQDTIDDFGPLMDIWQELNNDQKAIIKSCFKLLQYGEEEIVKGMLSLVMRKHEHDESKKAAQPPKKK